MSGRRNTNMNFLSDESLLAVFQDLMEGLDSDGTNNACEADLGGEELVIHKLDASTLTLTDLIVELERRGLQPHGFFSDDAKRLQECFDLEHEEYVASKKKELIDSNMEEAQERTKRRKNALMQEEVEEEKEEIFNNVRLAEWFRLIFSNSSPKECRIDINSISARSLSKALWSDTRIISIDVSNMNLPDISGSYLCRALSGNSTLVKYELGGNEFGSKTCKTLAESLLKNTTLRCLNIESNPMDGEECIELLSNSLAINSGIISLSLWRCGIGIEGGRKLAKAISSNSTLVCLEVGYNNFDSSDLISIAARLVSTAKCATIFTIRTRKRESGLLNCGSFSLSTAFSKDINRKNRDAKLAEDEDLSEQLRRASIKQLEIDAKKQKEEQDALWLEEQKLLRAESRRIDMEGQKQKELLEEQKKQQMERILKLEEARTQEKIKKSKGKKGKAKKKK